MQHLTEEMFIAWFVAHPFTHTLVVAVFGAVLAEVRADRESFSNVKAADPTATFGYNVAFRHYSLGGLCAAGTVITAEILHILSSSTTITVVGLLLVGVVVMKMRRRG